MKDVLFVECVRGRDQIIPSARARFVRNQSRFFKLS